MRPLLLGARLSLPTLSLRGSQSLQGPYFVPRLVPRTTRRMTSAAEESAAPVIPRGAVSAVVRCTSANETVQYLLIQRGKAPNKGMWSLPGGKLEDGESTLEGAVRELGEETIWTSGWERLCWHDSAFCATDSFGEGYHYLIAHCFAQLRTDSPPQLSPADDAADAGWFTKEDIHNMCDTKEITPGVFRVVQRAEDLSAARLLETTCTF
jgi:8-oxo-dGTP diphosphatase